MFICLCLSLRPHLLSLHTFCYLVNVASRVYLYPHSLGFYPVLFRESLRYACSVCIAYIPNSYHAWSWNALGTEVYTWQVYLIVAEFRFLFSSASFKLTVCKLWIGYQKNWGAMNAKILKGQCCGGKGFQSGTPSQLEEAFSGQRISFCLS